MKTTEVLSKGQITESAEHKTSPAVANENPAAGRFVVPK